MSALVLPWLYSSMIFFMLEQLETLELSTYYFECLCIRTHNRRKKFYTHAAISLNDYVIYIGSDGAIDLKYPSVFHHSHIVK